MLLRNFRAPVAKRNARSSSAVAAAAARIATAGPKALTNFPATQSTVLPNGLRVASEPGHGETVTVGVFLDAGSRYEDAKTNGVAHFLEHMFFKGTKKRTRFDLETEVENIGGHLNAYTSREQTVFYAKVLRKDVGQAMDLLSDILLNSECNADDIERERGVILREMQEVDNQMEEVIFDRLHETAFRDNALGRTILGPEENIHSITRANIIDYIQTHYTAPRMVIAGSGVPHAELVKLSEKYFSGVPAAPINGKQPYMEPAVFTGSDIRVRFDSMDKAYVALGFPTAGWTDPDNYSLMLIQTMLGSWEKASSGGQHHISPMISDLVSNKLVSSVMSFNTQYSDTGLFGVYAIADKYGLQDLMYVITRELVNLCYVVDDAQLEEAKNQLKMNILYHLDGTTHTAEDIGRQLLTYGRRIHPSEAFARIDAVDARAIKQVAQRYFYDQDFALAAVGPTFELPDYNWIRRRTYWLKI